MAKIAISPDNATLNKHRKVTSEASTRELPILANHTAAVEEEDERKPAAQEATAAQLGLPTIAALPPPTDDAVLSLVYERLFGALMPAATPTIAGVCACEGFLHIHDAHDKSLSTRIADLKRILGI